MSFGPTGSSKGGRSRETCLTCVFTFCIEDSRGLPADPASARGKLSDASRKTALLVPCQVKGAEYKINRYRNTSSHDEADSRPEFIDMR
jgi:hypothetical protein